MIRRQSVSPVRTVPEPEDREDVWVITHDGVSKEIRHLDPLRPDAPEAARLSPPDWLIRSIAAAVGLLAIVLWAVLRNH
jgi:hypothetical protein